MFKSNLLSKLLSVLVVFILVISLGACGSTDSKDNTVNSNGSSETTSDETSDNNSTGDSQEPVTINYWTRNTQSERQEQIRAMLDVFEIMNPDIKVNLLPVEDNEFPAQMTAVANLDTAPSLIETSQILSLSFYQEGFIDAEANEKIINTIGEDEFIDGALQLVKNEDGSHYGVPFTFFLQGIWYRTDWFEEAGLEPPNSWENILKAAEHFYKPEEKQYGILVGTTPENYAQQVFTQFATGNGAHLFDNAGNIVIDSPEFIETMKYYNELAQYNPPGAQTWRARDYYIQGKLPMFFYSTYIMDDLATADAAASSLTNENFSDLEGAEFDEQLASNTGFVPVIKGDKKETGYGEAMTLSVVKNKDERKTEAAIRLAEFFFQEENYVPYVHVAVGIMPVKKATISGTAFLSDPKGAYEKYGSERIMGFVNGIDKFNSFLSINNKPMPQASTILAKNILGQLIYNVTIEGGDIESEIQTAKKEMERAIEE